MRTIRWITVAAYAGLIFYLSSRAWPVPAELPFGTDKIVHGAIYAALGFGLVWALRATGFRGSRWTMPLATFIGFMYGVSDEIHQSFVPGRCASMVDVMADAIGSFIGALCGVVIARRFKSRDALSSMSRETVS